MNNSKIPNKSKIEVDNIFLDNLKDIMTYCRSGNLHKTQLYLRNNRYRDLNIKDDDGDSLLSVVMTSEEIKVEERKIAIISELIRHGIDLNITNKFGQNILHICYQKRFSKILHFLFSQEQPIDHFCLDVYNKIPLEYLLSIDIDYAQDSKNILNNSEIKNRPSDIAHLKDLIDGYIRVIPANTGFESIIQLVRRVPEVKEISLYKELNEALEYLINDFETNKLQQDLSGSLEIAKTRLLNDFSSHIERILQRKNNLNSAPLHLFSTNAYQEDYINFRNIYLKEAIGGLSLLGLFKLDFSVIKETYTKYNSLTSVERILERALDAKKKYTICHLTSTQTILPRDHMIIKDYFIQNIRFISLLDSGTTAYLATDNPWEATLKLIRLDPRLCLPNINIKNIYDLPVIPVQKIILATVKAFYGVPSVDLVTNLKELSTRFGENNTEEAEYYRDHLDFICNQYIRSSWEPRDLLWYMFLRFSNFYDDGFVDKARTLIHNRDNFYEYFDSLCLANELIDSYSIHFKYVIDAIVSHAEVVELPVEKFTSPNPTIEQICTHYGLDIVAYRVLLESDVLEVESIDIQYLEAIKLIHRFRRNKIGARAPIELSTELQLEEASRIEKAFFNFKFCEEILNKIYTLPAPTDPRPAEWDDHRNNDLVAQNLIRELFEDSVAGEISDRSYTRIFVSKLLGNRKVPSIKTIPATVSRDIIEAVKYVVNMSLEPYIALEYILRVYGFHSNYINLITKVCDTVWRGINFPVRQVALGVIISVSMGKEYLGLPPILQHRTLHTHTPGGPDTRYVTTFGLNNYHFIQDNFNLIPQRAKTNLFGRFDSPILTVRKELLNLLIRLQEVISLYKNALEKGELLTLVMMQNIFEHLLGDIERKKALFDFLSESCLQEIEFTTTQLRHYLTQDTRVVVVPDNQKDAVEEFISGTRDLINQVKGFKKSVERVNLERIITEVKDILSYYNQISIISNCVNFDDAALPLVIQTPETFISNCVDVNSRVLIVETITPQSTFGLGYIIKPVDTEIGVDLLTLSEFSIAVLKEDTIYSILKEETEDKKAKYQVVSGILNDYFKYVWVEQIKSILDLKQTNFNLEKFIDYQDKVINYTNLNTIYFKTIDRTTAPFYILSSDYLSPTDSWDFDKLYNFYDNQVIYDILIRRNNDMLIRNPETNLDIIHYIIRSQNYILLEKLMEYEITKNGTTIKWGNVIKQNTSYLDECLRIANRLKPDNEIIVDIISSMLTDTRQYMSSGIATPALHALEYYYNLACEDLISIIDGVDVIKVYYDTEKSGENCLLKKTSVIYQNIGNSALNLAIYLIYCIYNSFDIPHPNDEVRDSFAKQLVIVVLKYPEERPELSVRAVLETILEGISSSSRENVDLVVEHYDKLIQRSLGDIRSITSNLLRYYINKAITIRILEKVSS